MCQLSVSRRIQKPKGSPQENNSPTRQPGQLRTPDQQELLELESRSGMSARRVAQQRNRAIIKVAGPQSRGFLRTPFLGQEINPNVVLPVLLGLHQVNQYTKGNYNTRIRRQNRIYKQSLYIQLGWLPNEKGVVFRSFRSPQQRTRLPEINDQIVKRASVHKVTMSFYIIGFASPVQV